MKRHCPASFWMTRQRNRSSFLSSKFLLTAFHLAFQGLPLCGFLHRTQLTTTPRATWPSCIQKQEFGARAYKRFTSAAFWTPLDAVLNRSSTALKHLGKHCFKMSRQSARFVNYWGISHRISQQHSDDSLNVKTLLAVLKSCLLSSRFECTHGKPTALRIDPIVTL